MSWARRTPHRWLYHRTGKWTGTYVCARCGLVGGPFTLKRCEGER